MKSDRIMLLASDIGLFPIDLARRAPNRVIRFVGLLVAPPLVLLCLLLSTPVILIALIVSAWEAAQ